MTPKLLDADTVLAGFSGRDPKTLTKALLVEAMRLRPTILEASRRVASDRLLDSIESYLRGDISLKECVEQRKPLLLHLAAEEAKPDLIDEAYDCYQWACVNIPLAADEAGDARAVLGDLDDFSVYWNPGVNLQSAQQNRLERLQQYLPRGAVTALLAEVTESRSRVSGLAC